MFVFNKRVVVKSIEVFLDVFLEYYLFQRYKRYIGQREIVQTFRQKISLA